MAGNYMNKTIFSCVISISSAALAFLLFLTAARATMPELKVPDWVMVSSSFSNPPELNSISNAVCEISAPLFDIEGSVTCVIADTVKNAAPALRSGFKIKKGEKAGFRFPVQFVSESFGKTITLKVGIVFPKKELKNYISSMKINADASSELLERLDKASSNYEINSTLDFAVTAREGFSDFSAGMYLGYLKDGYVISDENYGPEFSNITSIQQNIIKYRQFMATVRKSAELKKYLSTQMDMVSGEDKYLRLLLAEAAHYMKSEDYKTAALKYENILKEEIFSVQNIETREIYMKASNNLGVLLFKTPGREKEGLDIFSRIIEDCAKYSDTRSRYAHYNIGIYHKLNKRGKEAADEFRKGLIIKPNFTACSSELNSDVK